MDSGMWEMIGLIVSVKVVCISGLLGYWMMLRHRRRLAERDNVEARELKGELEELRNETSIQVAELNERLDFVERLLSRGERRALPAVEHDTPV